MRTKFSIAAICLAGLVATGCNSESENKKPPQAEIQYNTHVEMNFLALCAESHFFYILLHRFCEFYDNETVFGCRTGTNPR